MKKKPRKTFVGTLQTFQVIPITDPAEQAALDRRCEAAEKILAADRRNGGKAKGTKSKTNN